jgi:NitT/TauT family transport system permease protein
VTLTEVATRESKVKGLAQRAAKPAASARPTDKAAAAQRRARQHERLATILSPFLLLAIWEFVARAHLVDVRFFPPPSSIARTFWNLLMSGELEINTAMSLTRVIVGFVLGAVPGLLLGVSMGLFPMVRAAAKSIIAITYPIPKLAILPLILLIFGLGEMSKYVVIAIAVFFPVAINTMVGVLGIEKIYVDVGRNFGASKLMFFGAIALRGAMPTIMAGMRIAWSTALLLIVAAEFVGADTGLGAMIWRDWQVFAIEEMYAGLIVIALLGYLSFILLDWIERRIVPWKVQH